MIWGEPLKRRGSGRKSRFLSPIQVECGSKVGRERSKRWDSFHVQVSQKFILSKSLSDIIFWIQELKGNLKVHSRFFVVGDTVDGSEILHQLPGARKT